MVFTSVESEVDNSNHKHVRTGDLMRQHHGKAASDLFPPSPFAMFCLRQRCCESWHKRQVPNPGTSGGQVSLGQ